MNTVRRLSVPFVQPLARLFNHDEVERERRGSITPHPVAPAPSSTLEQTVSNQVRSESQTDADLPLPVQDALYLYQLSQPSPLKLSSIAFCIADIVWRYRDSERVYNILQKRGMITPHGEIRTAAISNKFAHQFAFLSAFAQRRVIGLLFWWEEEEQRLKKLYEQEHDISEALAGLGASADGAMLSLFKVELQRTRMLITQKPSDRYDDTMSLRRREQLPAYAPPRRGGSRDDLQLYTEDSSSFVRG